jgi:hypothetical protein
MSNIIAATIDENFPIAGQDNDSQGFRDNFSVIKSGLSTAASEITNLENTAAKLDVANNFNGTLISNAEVSRLYGKVYGPVNQETESAITIDYALGDYQEIIVTNTVTLTFAGFPEQETGPAIEPGKRVYAKLRLALTRSTEGPAYTVTFGSSGAVIKKNFSSLEVSTDANAVKFVDVWTADNSTTFFVHYVGEFV